jgi:hypothetical protein
MTLTTHTTLKPNATVTDAWDGFTLGLSLASFTVSGADLSEAVEELEEAAAFLNDLKLDASELDGLIGELSHAVDIVSRVEAWIRDLHDREQADWPKTNPED